MGKLTVTGLLLAISVVVAWVGATSSSAAVQDGCNDNFVAPPAGPERPDQFGGFRQAVEDAAEPQLDIRLSWINRASNANCIALEVNFKTSADAAGEWVLLETLADPQATQYLHQDVPTSGEVCYRAYSSNDSGRSEYSRIACLEAFVPGTAPENGGGEEPSTNDSQDTLLIVVLAAALVVGALALATGGVLVLRKRAGRARVG